MFSVGVVCTGSGDSRFNLTYNRSFRRRGLPGSWRNSASIFDSISVRAGNRTQQCMFGTSGSVRFGRCYSSGLVRVRLILSSGSVRVRLMRVSQLRIWFGHSGNCKKLGTLEKYNTCKFLITRNSSGDEIANVNFLYDDIVHAVKIQ